MLLLWYLSLIVSVFTFIHGVSQRVPSSLFISALTFVPMALYFTWTNNWLQLGALFILVPIFLGIYFMSTNPKIKFIA